MRAYYKDGIAEIWGFAHNHENVANTPFPALYFKWDDGETKHEAGYSIEFFG